MSELHWRMHIGQHNVIRRWRNVMEITGYASTPRFVCTNILATRLYVVVDMTFIFVDFQSFLQQGGDFEVSSLCTLGWCRCSSARRCDWARVQSLMNYLNRNALCEHMGMCLLAWELSNHDLMAQILQSLIWHNLEMIAIFQMK
jgi:hypothetical protein